jgi:hypothetical protein
MSLTVSPNGLPLEQEYVPADDGAPIIAEERSKWQPAFFIAPMAVCVISALAGGVPALTDLGFLMLTGICVVLLIAEFRAFSFRWGIGGLLVYGGTLVWFCQDYLHNYLGRSFFGGITTSIIPAETVARAAAYHMLYVMMLSLGLRIRLKGYFERFLGRMPEPGSNTQYVILIVGMFLFGLSPYAFFTANHNPIEAFWADVMGGRASGALWTVGRSSTDGGSNLNYNYGAYLAQVLQVGAMGSILGAFYAINIAKTWAGRIFGFAIWLPSAMLGFGSGTRGALVMVTLPVVGFAFIRFQAKAAARLRRVSLRGYLILISMLLAMLAAVQIQISFRGSGFQEADLGSVADRPIEGNSMFSESLTGFYLIPQFLDPFYSKFPGEGMVMTVPDTAFWFFVTPIPRAVWNDKPIDPVWQWYNNTVAGTHGVEGTTISDGGVGHWYFRYGFFGVVEGGLFIGFLMGVTERLLRDRFQARPISILVALGVATFLFRQFRGLQWVEFHATMVGLVALAILVKVLHVIMGNPQASQRGFAVVQ